MKLGILDYASIILIILKFTGVIAWTWEQVLCLPIILMTIGFVEGVIEFFMKKQEELK